MKYGTLIEHVPVMAPNPLHVGKYNIYNPTDAQYAAEGYLPILETPYPVTEGGEETKYYTASWQEEDGQIVRVWTETEPPMPELDVPTWQETTNNRISSLESAVDGLIIAQLEVSGNV